MTVTKTLQEGGVRLREGSHPGRGQDSQGSPGSGGCCPWDAGGSQVSLQAEPQCQSFSYSRATLRARLLEGASLLLLRVLARRQTMPLDLVFPAINSEGDLCTASYVSRQPGWARSGPGWGYQAGMWEVGVGRMCLTVWGDTWGWQLGAEVTLRQG